MFDHKHYGFLYIFPSTDPLQIGSWHFSKLSRVKTLEWTGFHIRFSLVVIVILQFRSVKIVAVLHPWILVKLDEIPTVFPRDLRTAFRTPGCKGPVPDGLPSSLRSKVPLQPWCPVPEIQLMAMKYFRKWSDNHAAMRWNGVSHNVQTYPKLNFQEMVLVLVPSILNHSQMWAWLKVGHAKSQPFAAGISFPWISGAARAISPCSAVQCKSDSVGD